MAVKKFKGSSLTPPVKEEPSNLETVQDPKPNKETKEDTKDYKDYVKNIQAVKYNKDIAAAICDIVASGQGVVEACSTVGVSVPVFTNWRRKEPELDDKYRRSITESSIIHLQDALTKARDADNPKLQAEILAKIANLQDRAAVTKEVRPDSGKTPPLFGAFSMLPKEHLYHVAYLPKRPEMEEQDADPHELERG